MTLPTFETQPDERAELQPRIVEVLRGNGLSVYEVDGLFDLLVSNQDGEDSYLELKVRLASQNHSIPISRLQWQCLRDHNRNSKLERSYGVLIYDYRNGGTYAFGKASEIKNGISENQPRSTSYISAETLNGLCWVSPSKAKEQLLSWLRRKHVTSVGCGTNYSLRS